MEQMSDRRHALHCLRLVPDAIRFKLRGADKQADGRMEGAADSKHGNNRGKPK